MRPLWSYSKKPIPDREVMPERDVREDRKVGMNVRVRSELIGSIVSLMNGCEVPSTLRDQWEKYWVKLSVSVLNFEPVPDAYVEAIQHFGDVVRQPMPGHSCDSLLAYRIVRFMATGLTLIHPRRVHELIGEDMIRIVVNATESGAESQLTVPVYLQGVITGVVTGLNTYANLFNSDISDLIRSVGINVGVHFATAHSSRRMTGDLIPQAESDLGKEVVQISRMYGNPFGQGFLTSFWNGLDQQRRAEFVHRQYGLTEAILKSFVVRHVANLPVGGLMDLVFPQASKKSP